MLEWNPSTFLCAFAMWSMFTGISVAAPGEVFRENPVWSSLALLPVPEAAWGLLMIGLGVVLMTSVFVRSETLRCVSAITTGTVWCFVGVEMLLGGWQGGFLSAGGAWSIAGGFGCWVAAIQWLARR